MCGNGRIDSDFILRYGFDVELKVEDEEMDLVYKWWTRLNIFAHFLEKIFAIGIKKRRSYSNRWLHFLRKINTKFC